MFGVLAPDVVQRKAVTVDEPFALPGGITATLFMVPGKAPLYREGLANSLSNLGAVAREQGDLAAAVSVSRQTINSIEQGRYLPSLPLALALARYFETTVEEMFDDDH